MSEYNSLVFDEVTSIAMDDARSAREEARQARARVAVLEAALTHAVEIAENKRVGGTWDDLLPYRALLNPKR